LRADCPVADRETAEIDMRNLNAKTALIAVGEWDLNWRADCVRDAEMAR